VQNSVDLKLYLASGDSFARLRPGLFGKIQVKKSGLYPFANAISLIRFWRRFVLSIICERTPIHSLAGRDEDSANPLIRRAT
jgi:hypothetical protein